MSADALAPAAVPAAPALILTQEDSWLQPLEPVLLARQQRLADRLAIITKEYGSLSKYATAHQRLGLHYDTKRRGYVVREWAPGAEAVSLVGDFNYWNRAADPLTKDETTGIWEGFVADDDSGRRPAAGEGALEQVAPRGGVPVEHLPGHEGAGAGGQHEAGVDLPERHPAGGRDRPFDGAWGEEAQGRGLDEGGEGRCLAGKRVSRRLAQEPRRHG